MAEPLVLADGQVKGDITSCKLENQKLSVKRDSLFSLREDTTYATYNVCTKEVVREYTTPAFTALGGGVIVLGICVAVILILRFAVWAFDW